MYSKYKLLVVDDEDELKDILVDILINYGFTVRSAHSGNSAYEIVNKERIDLIISDIRMADGDDMTLFNKIRENSSEVPVIVFMTGYNSYTEEEFINMGAKDLIYKPFDSNKIINIVKNSLSID